MTSVVSLHPATEADWPAIWPIWHQVVAAGDTYCYDPESTCEQVRALWLDSAAETRAATIDDRVVGAYEITPNQSGPGSHVVNGMQFNAVAATNVGAIGLYQRLGFQVVGRVPGAFRHPHDGRVDLVVMYRELDRP